MTLETPIGGGILIGEIMTGEVTVTIGAVTDLVIGEIMIGEIMIAEMIAEGIEEKTGKGNQETKTGVAIEMETGVAVETRRFAVRANAIRLQKMMTRKKM